MAQHSVSPELTNAEPLQLPQAALQLLARPAFVVDVFPASVPTWDGPYYEIERYLAKGGNLRRYARQVSRAALLLCAYLPAKAYLLARRPAGPPMEAQQLLTPRQPQELERAIRRSVEKRKSGPLLLYFEEEEALLAFLGGYETLLCGQSEKLLSMLEPLCRGAGLYLLPPPRAALGRSTAEDTADGSAYNESEIDPSALRQNEQ